MLNLRRSIAMVLSFSLLACAGQSESPANPPVRPAWMPPPVSSLPFSSRIGIMTVLDSELVHVKAGTFGIGNSVIAEKAPFDLPGYVTESLRKTLLAQTTYKPVLVRPSGRLIRDKAIWQKSWNEKTGSFAADYQREFDAVSRQNQLAMLIIISAPEEDDGIVATAQHIMGSGYYSRSFFGKKQTAVFSTIHFYRVQGNPGKLLKPVSAPDERLYAAIPNFPNPAPEPLYGPMQTAVNQAVRDLVDQKVGAFVTMMK